MNDLKLISVNVNGLNDYKKRKLILTKLVKQNVDIICLQEVHIKKDEGKCLEYIKYDKIFTSLAEKKKRGVAIYVKKGIKAELKYNDTKGRTLMIEVRRGDSKMLLVGIYVPNKKQGEYFKRLHEQLGKMEYNESCIIGDFNGIVDPEKDHKSNKTNKNKRASLPRAFFDLVDELSLIDIWRTLHPNDRQYTFYSNPQKSWSIIDMAWITRKLGLEIGAAEISSNT